MLLFAAGCQEAPEPVTRYGLSDARRESQPVSRVTPGELYGGESIDLGRARAYLEPLDQDSVEMIRYAGGVHYQPVELCHRCNTFLLAYERTGDSLFRERAIRTADAILDICDNKDGALYARYPFAYRLHDDDRLSFSPPWYSGMAQGEVTGILARVHELTGDSTYLRAADSVFLSLLRVRGEGAEPWVAYVDTGRFYWIEEFPQEVRPGKVLNGFVAALLGVYDYYRVTGSDSAKLVWDLSVTTLKHYLPSYRRDGDYSYYCLGHKGPASPEYHRLHIRQMEQLHAITGDPLFSRMAETFRADAREREGS